MSSQEYFSEKQSWRIAILTRTSACLSLICALYMVVQTFKNRSRMFHRLMLGLSLHLISYSFWHIYGSAAVPQDTPDVWGASGTIQSCTLQGFFIQLSFAVPLYYASLSLYSFCVVYHNFDFTKFKWIEKWIHLAVNAYPIASASYLARNKALNPSGHYICWIASVPFGCGTDSGLECIRGPQNIDMLAGLFAGLPIFLAATMSPCVMGALYIYVRKTKGTSSIPAKLTPALVIKQGGVYLLGFYWTYLLAIINNCVQWFDDTKVYGLAAASLVNLNLMGVWILLVYRYFRLEPTTTIHTESKHARAGQAKQNSLVVDDHKSIRSWIKKKDTGSCVVNSANVTRNKTSRRRLTDSTEFNIFDGTNASGAFADFVFSGDSDDEAADVKESVLWNDVQQHI